MLKVLVAPWASTFRVRPVPGKLIVLPIRPSAAPNWTEVRPTAKTSVLPGPDSPSIVIVPPVPAKASVSPPGIDPTEVPPRATFRPVSPPLGATTYWLPAATRKTRLSGDPMFASPSQGLNATLPTAFAPWPPGLAEFAGPVPLPHQSNVASTDLADWLSWTPVASPAKLSSVAVRVAVSDEPEPTAMPVASLATVLLTTVAAPPEETAMPVASLATVLLTTVACAAEETAMPPAK